MGSYLDYTNKSALSYNEGVLFPLQEICDPLFKNFEITVFVYSHFFNNGTYLDLCTDLEWQKYHLEHFAHNNFVKDFVQNIYQKKIKYILWNNNRDLPKDKIFSQFIKMSCNFNIWHGLTIYSHHQNSLEAFHFATTKDNYKLINFYLNHMDILNRFISYFHDRASSFISIPFSKQLITLSELSPLFNIQQFSYLEDKVKCFVEQTYIKRHYLMTKNGQVSLAKREMECLLHLNSSRTSKEIANLLSISPRTVECYIDNLKKKFGCLTKSQLVEIFTKNNKIL